MLCFAVRPRSDLCAIQSPEILPAQEEEDEEEDVDEDESNDENNLEKRRPDSVSRLHLLPLPGSNKNNPSHHRTRAAIRSSPIHSHASQQPDPKIADSSEPASIAVILLAHVVLELLHLHQGITSDYPFSTKTDPSTTTTTTGKSQRGSLVLLLRSSAATLHVVTHTLFNLYLLNYIMPTFF
ncbi:hypothetical protein Fcan01_21284 [Folsomia candida]|uniref:Uncharacterized protein n=1 Tax=Folsomia candida TaxID=158441 RepID=A0A226DH23_FOLCA|nr:hypothetical protein Fcan01_21284 [Folsomia candida]